MHRPWIEDGSAAWRRAAPFLLACTAVALLTLPTGGDAPRLVAADNSSTTHPTTEPSTEPEDRADGPTGGPATGTTTSTPADGTGTATTAVAAVETSSSLVAPPSDPPQDVTRSIPDATPAATAPSAPPPAWAASVTTTAAGYIGTAIGCASGSGAAALDSFFAARVGPLLGADYQHVVSLGNGRAAWFFQDAFIDPGGTATRLDQAFFAHNLLLLQDGNCFTMLHRGTAAKPTSFEPGNGERSLTKWFWPMGAETSGNRVRMFWVEMAKDGYEPGPGDGLGWHPARLWLATYDATTMQRLSFDPAPNSGVSPIYGYAVASDSQYSYLFGNTFEQNLVREGGFWSGPHSATAVYLARVPRGRLDATPEYRTADGWSGDPGAAVAIVQRYWAENPMQPRFLDGQWVAATKVDGYWGDELSIDVANNPWGPWTTVDRRWLSPRGSDPAMNTYHAHLLPWRSGNGSLIVSVSQNARQMTADAFPHPERYRIAVFTSGWWSAPPDPPPTTTSTTSTSTTTSTTTTTTSTTTSTTTTTTTPATTTTRPTTTTTRPSTTTTSSSTSTTSSTTSTTTPPTSSSSTSTTAA